MNKFEEKLLKIQKRNNSLVSVGLDSNFKKIPKFIKKGKSKADAIFEFNKSIINATYDLVCAYKPNIAFYEAEGLKGLKSLKKTVDYICKNYPQIPVILDAKRADIGSTNEGYVKAIFDYFGFDAVTVHPYLGQEALEPFLKRKDKGIIVLCRTSNPGAGEFQDLSIRLETDPSKGPFLYQYVAKKVAKDWNKNNNCGLVVGATYPKELNEIRQIVGDMILLIPGIGKQGGVVEKTVRAGKNSKGGGMIINSSRSIVFASAGKDFAQVARKKTEELKDLINKFR